MHYSSEHPIKAKWSHAEILDIKHFETFIKETRQYNFDIMMEIKDKEKSALKALNLIVNDPKIKSK